MNYMLKLVRLLGTKVIHLSVFYCTSELHTTYTNRSRQINAQLERSSNHLPLSIAGDKKEISFTHIHTWEIQNS